MSYSEGIAALGLRTPWDDLITALGGDPASIALIKGVIATESAWNPGAINPADPSYGLMQILAGSRGPFPMVSTTDLLDPSTNITLGATYLKQQVNRFGMPGGVAAYNSGTPRTLPGGQYMNQAYVDSVLSYQSYYLNAMMGQVNYGVPPDATAPPLGTVYDPGVVPDYNYGVPPDDTLYPSDAGFDPTGYIPDFTSPTTDVTLVLALAALGIGAVYAMRRS